MALRFLRILREVYVLNKIFKGYPEVLSPAGSVESLHAAVNAGCDAVYIGGGRFGARAYADNPEYDKLIEAINFCHMHGVRVYMTVNTLLKDNEIEQELYNYISPYYEAGIDAVIVQDTGVMKKMHEWFPDLNLHASTQMTLTMGKSTQVLEKYGITRIVPARELTLEELKQMRMDTNAEIEVFVHGALCYCYSGQCLFSSMSGNRSGNRGRCAQPCRLPYMYKQQGNLNESYILSLKELCNLFYIGELADAGISSFKIEGRMKRPEYTAFVTSIYRKYTDLYIKYGKEGYYSYIADNRSEFEADIEAMAELYNREGFTSGYLKNDLDNMLSSIRPKHGGILVGKVLSVGNGSLKYKLLKDVSAQDVVEFRDIYMKPEYEYTLGIDIKKGETVNAKYKKGSIIHKGDEVYRTKNAALIEEIRKKYIAEDKKILIEGEFSAVCGEKATLSVWYSADNIRLNFDSKLKVTAYGDICERADKRPVDEKSVLKSISQTGGTDFVFKNLDINIEGNIFLPVSMLKNMRRTALDMLREKILNIYRRKQVGAKSSINIDRLSALDDHRISTDVVYKAGIMTMQQLSAVVKCDRISEIYIKTELMDDDEIKLAYRLVKDSGRKCCIVLPHIFRKKQWDNYEAMASDNESMLNLKWDRYIIRNFEEYAFLCNVLKKSKDNIVTDSGMYIMNRSAYDFWKDEQVKRHTIPFELTASEIKCLAAYEGMEAVLYSLVPLMVSAQCIKRHFSDCNSNDCKISTKSKTLFSDNKDNKFIAVNYCKYCYNTIYHSEPLYLAEFENEMYDMGIREFRYDFTVEDKEDTTDVLFGRCSKKTRKGHYLHEIL